VTSYPNDVQAPLTAKNALIMATMLVFSMIVMGGMWYWSPSGNEPVVASDTQD
jgi:hypothetical protein